MDCFTNDVTIKISYEYKFISWNVTQLSHIPSFLLLCRLMSLAMRLRAFWLMKFNLQSFLLYFASVCSASQIWCDTNFSVLERIREMKKNCEENNGNESNLTFSVGRGCFLLFFIISQDKRQKTEERHQTREI